MGVDNPDTILAGADERGFFVRAVGSIRASVCYPLRERLLARLEESADIPAVYVDLSGCAYMDSTFIGLLVAADRRVRKANGGRLHVLAPSAPCIELLGQLGLMELLLVERDAGPSFPPLAALEKPTGRPATEFVLEAHQELMETSEEAQRKFALLRDQLERKLKLEKPPEGTR